MEIDVADYKSIRTPKQTKWDFGDGYVAEIVKTIAGHAVWELRKDGTVLHRDCDRFDDVEFAIEARLCNVIRTIECGERFA